MSLLTTEKPKSIDSTEAVAQSSDPSELFNLHPYDTWVTDWSVYVGEERLGKIRIMKTRFGMFTSVHEDGRRLVSSITQKAVTESTYWHLKWKADGYDGEQTQYDGTVGGKR